jgi:hypothetical protein
MATDDNPASGGAERPTGSVQGRLGTADADPTSRVGDHESGQFGSGDIVVDHDADPPTRWSRQRVSQTRPEDAAYHAGTNHVPGVNSAGGGRSCSRFDAEPPCVLWRWLWCSVDARRKVCPG